MSDGAVAVILREITGDNRASVLALRVAPAQQRFVGSVQAALDDAAAYARANPWYRAVYAGEQPVGYVMVSWNVRPQPPDIIGPWFLWKLLIDQHHQHRGYGTDVVRQIAQLVHAAGATELLTSYVPDNGGMAEFCRRVGFVPTGDLDSNGEIITRLTLPTGRRPAHNQANPNRQT
jgi:diamine N-acetyltransferase